MQMSFMHNLGSGISTALTFWLAVQWLESFQLNLLKDQWQKIEFVNLWSQFPLESLKFHSSLVGTSSQ